MELIMAFGSTHKALKAEEILKDAEITMRLLPAPKALAAYCDLVISIDEAAMDRARKALDEGGVGPKKIYMKEGESYVAL